jgi:hypothetical protein
MNTEIKHLMEEGSSLGRLAVKTAVKRSKVTPKPKPSNQAKSQSPVRTSKAKRT